MKPANDLLYLLLVDLDGWDITKSGLYNSQFNADYKGIKLRYYKYPDSSEVTLYIDRVKVDPEDYTEVLTLIETIYREQEAKKELKLEKLKQKELAKLHNKIHKTYLITRFMNKILKIFKRKDTL